MRKFGLFVLIICMLCVLYSGYQEYYSSVGDDVEANEVTPLIPAEKDSILDTEPPCPPETEQSDTVPVIPEKSTFSIQYIDVGQADAALVECDGHYMLIDGGNKSDSSLIYAVLKQKNVEKLDIVVGTHAHEDHIGGLPGAFNYTTSGITLCPVTEYETEAFNDFKRYAESRGGGITVPNVGDKYYLGCAEVEILGVNSTADSNNCSIILMITYGETKFLFMGDADRSAENVILETDAQLKATVLKVGHHGNEASTTYPFLRQVMPEYAIISVGADNPYGHPTDKTLSRLRDAEVKVYRTDMQGDIYCVSDGRYVKITVERNANADTLWEAGITDTTEVQSIPTTGYILNTNTRKFHIPSCSSVKQMSEKNKKIFNGTSDEAVAMGYEPCGNCKPR